MLRFVQSVQTEPVMHILLLFNDALIALNKKRKIQSRVLPTNLKIQYIKRINIDTGH